MTQTAVVTQVIGNKARVQVKRISACAHNCEECGGACSEMMKSGPVSVLARNPLNAKVGDRVVVASDTGSILRMAALVYLLPIVLFFVGYFLSRPVIGSEGGAIGMGCVCFAFSVAVIIFADRVVRRRNREMFSIVEICRN